MKAVADLVNLSIASLYVAMVGIGCVPTSFSFFHIASLPVRQSAKHYRLLSQQWSNTAKVSLPEGYPDSEGFQTFQWRRWSMRSRGKPDIATPGSHCPMATPLLNSDVNGGTVARVSARGHSRRQR